MIEDTTTYPVATSIAEAEQLLKQSDGQSIDLKIGQYTLNTASLLDAVRFFETVQSQKEIS